MRAGSRRTWLLAALLLAAPGAYGLEDITKFNTIETRSAATIDRIKISNPRFAFRRVLLQPFGGLDQPVVSFGVANYSAVAIKRIILRAELRQDSRAVPLAQPQIDFMIPGGLQPGESRRFLLDAEVVGDWNQVSRRQANGARLTLDLAAVEDASGRRIVK